MDIFSIGCVLLELLTDGRQIPFTLSQVIDYRRMDDHSARQYLRGIFNEVPEGFHELLYIMLDRNPNRRKDEYSKVL
jgi:serine/threonine protein kinase